MTKIVDGGRSGWARGLCAGWENTGWVVLSHISKARWGHPALRKCCNVRAGRPARQPVRRPAVLCEWRELFLRGLARCRGRIGCRRWASGAGAISRVLWVRVLWSRVLEVGVLKDAVDLRGVLAGGSQAQVLSERYQALSRQFDFVGGGIGGRVNRESICLDEIENGVLRAGLDGLLGGIDLRRDVFLLEEDDGQISEVGSSMGGIGFDGRGYGRIGFVDHTSAGVDLAQTREGRCDELRVDIGGLRAGIGGLRVRTRSLRAGVCGLRNQIERFFE